METGKLRRSNCDAYTRYYADRPHRNFLFSRVIPNLSRIGLLTDSVRPKFEALGLLEYEHAPDDFEVDWVELEKPLEDFNEIPEAI